MTERDMTTERMIYLISRAAATCEMRTGDRPDVIEVSRDLYNMLMYSFMVTAHVVQKEEVVGSEERLFGMKLGVNPLKEGMKFILGTEFDLDEMNGKRRERHEQLHDHREPGEGSGDGDHGERDQLVPLCGCGEEETPEAGRG